jgi:spore maturation protein CgeB
MNYRFVKVTNYYRNFLNYYYKKNPGVVQLSYQDQYNHIMNEAFGWSNFYQIHLIKLGNEAYELVANAEPLQSAWANEHGFNSRGEDLLLEQLKFYKPDVIFFQDSLSFSYLFLQEVKKRVPSVKKIIGWCCSPYTKTQLENYKLFDFVFTCSPGFVKVFEDIGIKVYRLNHAFEASLLPRIQNDNNYPESDFVFIGSFIGSKDFHNERIKLIESLIIKKINLSLYTNLPNDNTFYVFGQKIGYSISQFLKSVGLSNLALSLPAIKKVARLTEMPRRINFSEEFKQSANPTPLYGIEMFKALLKSKIGFNSHGGVAGDYAANVRLFEVTGVGSCLLTDYKKNITDFFEPDREVVTYKSAEECIEKINWLLSHPDDLKQIAEAGQKRTLRDHTFEKRAEELHEIITKELSKN